MKGSMRQRGSAWELRVYLGADPVSGKPRYVTKTVQGGKREAQKALNELVVAAERGTIARTRTTVGELLDAWLELARADFSPKTVRETSGMIERYLRPALGDVPLNKLTAATLDRYYRTMLDGGGHDGRPLSPGTIRRVHGILRRALTQGVRWGWIGVNPATSASPPRVPAPTINPPTPTELAKLQASIESDDPEFATFVRLAAITGARRSEVLGLRWPDVDLEGSVLTISRGLVVGPDGLVEKDTKTHQVRRVALDAATVETLRVHRSAADERAARFAGHVAADAFVFANDVAGRIPWFPDSASRRFRQACRRIDLHGVRLHDLRHYVATRLLTAGVDVRTVSGRLGHRNAATTLNVYAHFVPESDQEAAELLARLIPPQDSVG
jgi:integrase